MRRLLAFAGVVATVILATASPVAADALTIRKVDTTAFPQVVITTIASGRTPDAADFHVRENGRIVKGFDVVPIGKTAAPVGIVLAIDTSGSMASSGRLDAAKEAARRFIASKLPNDEIAVVSFATAPRIVANFTADARVLTNAVDELQPGGETALWDGVQAGVTLLGGRPELQPNLVVLSDGEDTASTSSLAAVQAEASRVHAVVFAIALGGAGANVDALGALTAVTGGETMTATPSDLASLYGQVQQRLQSQYEIRYTSPDPGAATLDVEVVAGGIRAAVSAATGAVSQGQSARPQRVEPDRSPLHGTTGRLLIMALCLGAVASGGYVLLGLSFQSRRGLNTLLAGYGSRVETDDGDADTLVKTPILRRAVSLTGHLAGRSNTLSAVEQALERADIALRAAEALFFAVAGVATVTALALIVSRSVFVAGAALVVAALVPMATLRFRAARRRRRFLAQLPDALQMLAGTLRAGYSLLQGVEAVCQEVEEPMACELKRVLAEARLGRSLDDALEDAARRMDSEDFSWVVMAVQVQREVGGNLAELLLTVNETMVARERLRREVKALTAEGRMSAIVLGILPVGLGLALWVMNPEYIGVLFDRTIGQVMLAGSAVMAVLGFAWMKKLIKIEA